MSDIDEQIKNIMVVMRRLAEPNGLTTSDLEWGEEQVKALISDQVAKAIEGALDQVGVFVLGGTVRLNDIYGNDYRNNYGYNETQVRDAANWIQDRQRVKLETLRATLNGVKK